MKSISNNGGSAFPITCPFPAGKCEYGHICGSEGMSIRDWFAGMALQGLLASSETTGNIATDCKDAYRYADSMLIARGKNGNP